MLKMVLVMGQPTPPLDCTGWPGGLIPYSCHEEMANAVLSTPKPVALSQRVELSCCTGRRKALKNGGRSSVFASGVQF